ncbi:MAG: AMP-binding protein [Pseudomonadota bacterium]
MSLDHRYSSISDIARDMPDRPAAIMAGTGAAISFRELNRASIALARVLREYGLGFDDKVAILMENDLDFFVAMWAIRRAGMHIVPVNWHLTPDEILHIVSNSGASGLITTAKLIDHAVAAAEGNVRLVAKLTTGSADRGFESIAYVRDSEDDTPDPDEKDGAPMYYSGGTSGKPKGILRPLSGEAFGAPSLVEQAMTTTYGLDATTVYLSPAPLYHAAPTGWTMMVQRVGGTVILLQSFDAEAALRTIPQYGVTHAQFVPTHFIRMLRLDDAVRASVDTSTLRYVIHAAAPCSAEVKARMIEWLGSVVYEYYGGSERCGFAAIGPQDALAHPGSVGRSLLNPIHILDPETRAELPLGEPGLIYFDGAEPFEYHGEPGKSAACFNAAGWGTMGDMGYLDDEGYLYLTDRLTNMIISGGVNIYPQEVEDLLALHPLVDDVAVLGLPDPEYGEKVHAFITLPDGKAADDALAAELIAYCRDNLAHYKCPRGVDFIDTMPRLPSGKLQKRHLLSRYAAA